MCWGKGEPSRYWHLLKDLKVWRLGFHSQSQGGVAHRCAGGSRLPRTGAEVAMGWRDQAVVSVPAPRDT